ncbi:aminoglycoside phosphotransferase family protein [uncultured Friedmanniella sp.]|uniref:aminoglycoside phosphotransferase family protein n=1 Tax=uncultured Friedmanniella sp. TaxID=335381 RepID=UPI0035CA576F
MPTGPPDSYGRGIRLPWAGLPAEVRGWVAGQLGGTVTEVEDRVGGFSPGCAAVVATGRRRGFVKAVSDRPNATSLELYRRERDRFAALPDHPALPKPLAGTDLTVAGVPWTVTLFPALPGQPPAHPWTEQQARLVFDRWGELSRSLVAHDGAGLPDSSELVGFFDRWPELLGDADDPWSVRPWVRERAERLVAGAERVQREVVGSTPAHTDLRADNVLVGEPVGDAEPPVWFVDWAEARTAAAWVDPALLAADLVVSGADRAQGGQLDVRGFLAEHPTTSGIDPELLGHLLAALAATLHRLSRRPAPPGLPTIRDWQARCAERLLGFLSRDLGPPDRLW